MNYKLVLGFLNGEFGWNKFHQTRVEVPVGSSNTTQVHYFILLCFVLIVNENDGGSRDNFDVCFIMMCLDR